MSQFSLIAGQRDINSVDNLGHARQILKSCSPDSADPVKVMISKEPFVKATTEMIASTTSGDLEQTWRYLIPEA